MSFAYTIVGGRESEQSLYFMLNALLQSRIHVNEESTDDEDVNIYLASLLHAYLSDGIHANDAISSYDADVVQNAESGDLRNRYRVYRAYADHALVMGAVFARPWTDRRSRNFHPVRACEQTSARGKHYYALADSLEQKLRQGSTAVSGVLTKLAERFDLYGRILGQVRSSHLNLFARMSTGEAFHLERHAQEGAFPTLVREGRNKFLDAYSAWMTQPTRAAERKVNRLSESLAKLDSSFWFEGV